MKTVLALMAAAMLVSTGSVAYAAPFKAADKNPQVVAYYPDGPHSIPGNPDATNQHYGADLVMRAGKSGNFQQWFYGWSVQEGTHGEHTVWRVSKDGECPDSWFEVPLAYPGWGDYLVPGVDYCTKTNSFKASK